MSKTPTIGGRIDVLRLKMNNIAIAELEKGHLETGERLLGNGVISDWKDKPIDWTSDKLDKFLNHWNINRVWWKTGEGEVFNTPVPKPTDNKENQLARAEIYQRIVEGQTEYFLVPKKIMDEYEIVPKVELAESRLKTEELIKSHDKALSAKDKLILVYEKQIAALTAPQPVLEPK